MMSVKGISKNHSFRVPYPTEKKVYQCLTISLAFFLCAKSIVLQYRYICIQPPLDGLHFLYSLYWDTGWRIWIQHYRKLDLDPDPQNLNPAEIMDSDPRFVQNTDLNRTKITEPATLLGLRSNSLFQVMILILFTLRL